MSKSLPHSFEGSRLLSALRCKGNVNIIVLASMAAFFCEFDMDIDITIWASMDALYLTNVVVTNITLGQHGCFSLVISLVS